MFTFSGVLITRETVEMLTPASSATSKIVFVFFPFVIFLPNRPAMKALS
jgi:hypothetical protein